MDQPHSRQSIRLNSMWTSCKGLSLGPRESKHWFKGSADMWYQSPDIKFHLPPHPISTWWTDHTNVTKVWFPKKALNNHLHHPKRMILVITMQSSGHIYGYQIDHHNSHQDNQTSIREDGKLHRRHTVPNRRIPIKIPIRAVTEILQNNKINKKLAAAWPGTRIVRLHLDYYLTRN